MNKTLGLVSLSVAVALASGCAQRKPKIGSLGSHDATYTNGVSGDGSGGFGTNGGATTAGIGDNNGLSYSESGLPGTGGNNVVYFEYDSTALSDQSYAKLNKHVAYLKENANASVTLAGHADERGTREYNAALGQRRANAVKDYLTTNGVNAGQIDTVSYGEERPIGSHQQNRRVEVTY